MADNQNQPEVFIGSRIKAKNGYGQNGFQGASSDLPGEHTTSGFLPQVTVPDKITASENEGGNWQTRPVSKDGYPPAHGMKARNDTISFPTKADGDAARVATKAAKAGNYPR